MGSWVVRGLGIFALVVTGGASWAATTWEDLHVVAAAPPSSLSGDETADPDAVAATSSTIVAVPPPAGPPTPPATTCTSADEPVQGDPTTSWATIVIDRQRGLAANYVPPDLVAVSAAGFSDDDGSPNDRVRQIAVPDLAALRQAAIDNGTPLVLVSAFRSYDHQARVFDRAVEQTSAQEADLTTARAGHSEHQLGTTIDVLDTESSELSPAFASTRAGRWLLANAPNYGFVASYPDVPVERSCYGFEPWHLRYVGRDVARQIVESGLTPREWMLAPR